MVGYSPDILYLTYTNYVYVISPYTITRVTHMTRVAIKESHLFRVPAYIARRLYVIGHTMYTACLVSVFYVLFTVMSNTEVVYGKVLNTFTWFLWYMYLTTLLHCTSILRIVLFMVFYPSSTLASTLGKVYVTYTVCVVYILFLRGAEQLRISLGECNIKVKRNNTIRTPCYVVIMCSLRIASTVWIYVFFCWYYIMSNNIVPERCTQSSPPLKTHICVWMLHPYSVVTTTT